MSGKLLPLGAEKADQRLMLVLCLICRVQVEFVCEYLDEASAVALRTKYQV